MASTTSTQFNEILNSRDFCGKLNFNYREKTIAITVVKTDGNNTNKTSTMKDMKALSGGERSFAQISLLLALGKSIDCPFRAMDEFDVFMDALNRKQTLELLIEAVTKDINKQFIFITPNDLSSLEESEYISIQKLAAPRE
jgi:chromosome segregation ATPase